jgi:hypothetical protein
MLVQIILLKRGNADAVTHQRQQANLSPVEREVLRLQAALSQRHHRANLSTEEQENEQRTNAPTQHHNNNTEQIYRT